MGAHLRVLCENFSPYTSMTWFGWFSKIFASLSLSLRKVVSALKGMHLASRASGCLFGHPDPEKAPLRTPKIFCEEFLKMSTKST